MITYTLTSGNAISRSDGAFIPNDINNRDYAEYQTWLAAGGVPNPYIAPPMAPLTATPFQFRAGLTVAGIRDKVEAAVANSNNQTIKDAYEYAAYFSEVDPFIIQMSASLGLNTDAVHSLFVSMQHLTA